MTEAVTGVAGVGVGGVDAPSEVLVAEVGDDFGAGDLKEGADDAFAGDGKNSGEAGGRSAPQKTEEYGFRLVVLGVAGGEAVDETGSLEFGEEGTAGLTAFIFGKADGPGGGVEGQTVGLGEVGDEAFVGVGVLPAELVVEVDDGEGDAVGGGQLAKDGQQTNRIRAAGNRDTDAVARAQHVITSENSLNFLEQAFILSPGVPV